MSASSRTSIPSSPPIKLRKKAKTQVLLGDDFEETVTEILEPPLPLKNDADYNEKRLKEGLKYADWTLRNTARKLSPIGERGLMLYKEACARLLDFENGEVYENDDGEDIVQEVKDEYMSTIRMYERSIQYTACLRTTRTEDAQALQDELIMLQRLSFYARYGDILAVACRELKSEAEAKKVEGWKVFSRTYWTEISAQLAGEEMIWKTVLDGAPRHSECPVTIALSQACYTVGFSPSNMTAIIHHYAKRNELLHSDMIPMLKNGQFDDLKKRLHDDFCAVPLVVAPAEGVQAQLMISVIDTIIDKWFTRDPDDPTNYQMWMATPSLFQLRKELKGANTPSQKELTNEIAADIIKAVKKREREAEKEKELTEQLDSNLGLLTIPIVPKVKRVASSQLEAERVRNKRMKMDWAKLMNLVKGTKDMSDVYLSEYGELSAPPHVLHDQSLDD